MKVLFLAPGNSIHSYKWITTINELDHQLDCYWCSFERFSQETNANIKSFHIGSAKIPSIFSIIYALWKCFCKAHKLKPDVIHIHSLGTYSLFSCVPWMLGIPFIVTPWGSDIIFGSRNLFKKFLLWFSFSTASAITCDAIHIKNLIISISKKSTPQIINFGIDTSFFCRIGEFHKLERGEYKILSTRNHEPIYDIATLISALKILHDKGLRVKATVAGSGSLTESLVNLTKTYELESIIEFTGRYSYATLPIMMNSHDIYVSTSLSDAGIASSIAEAMSSEMIVIASNSGENSYWIDETRGFLFETGSPQSLADCIEYVLIKSHIDWYQLGCKARKMIIDYNDINNEMTKALDLLYAISSTNRE